MKVRVTWLLAFSLTTLAGCQVKPESVQLTSAELQALFVDKTVESYNLVNGSTSFTYYHPDGSVLQERYWEMRQGRWRVADNMICLAMDHKTESCRAVMSIGDRYYKFRTSDEGLPEKVIRYRQFLTGNRL